MLEPLPVRLFGTQAPNATTVLLAAVVFVAMIIVRRDLRAPWYWLCGIGLALASAALVGIKNYVQEVVVSPGLGTPPGDLRFNADVLELVAVAQVVVAVLYILLGAAILKLWPDRWRRMNTLLLTAAVASMWAALASAEWARTFRERARHGGMGDYEPVSQFLHIALVAVICFLSLRLLWLWWDYYRVPGARRRKTLT